MSRSAISPIPPQPRPLPAAEAAPVAASDPLYEFSKRALDVAASLSLLALLSPLLLAIAVGVKLTSPGPVLFRQKRLGRGGTTFWCLKFRTMVRDAESLLAKSEQLRAQFDENYK